MEWFWQKLRVFPFNESKDFRIRQLKPFFSMGGRASKGDSVDPTIWLRWTIGINHKTKLKQHSTVGNALNASTWKCESLLVLRSTNSFQRLHVSAYHSRLRQSRRDRKPGSLFIRRSQIIIFQSLLVEKIWLVRLFFRVRRLWTDYFLMLKYLLERAKT